MQSIETSSSVCAKHNWVSKKGLCFSIKFFGQFKYFVNDYFVLAPPLIRKHVLEIQVKETFNSHENCNLHSKNGEPNFDMRHFNGNLSFNSCMLTSQTANESTN